MIAAHKYEIHATVVAISIVIFLLLTRELRNKYFRFRGAWVVQGCVFAIPTFALLSLISPWIDFSISSSILSAIFSIVGYNILQQLSGIQD